MELKIKDVVRDKYSQIAQESSNCGCSCCGSDSTTFDYTVMSDDYSAQSGYVKDADLGLGCGIPTEFADIKVGDTILDLGSGAGNDVFVARSIVGDKGKVIGLDFTDEMLAKANRNLEKLGFDNVKFIKGDIEDMPIENQTVDVVISNCVLNLVPDKKKAFTEINRVLKPNGHFCVSDIVIKGVLPEKMQNAAAMYTGCVAGALQYDEYINIIVESGFKNISVPKSKIINIPDDILRNYLSEEELNQFKESGAEILSITAKAEK